MRVSLGRWLLSLLIGYGVASGLNWAVAEKLLNDIIRPGFGPLMRTNANAQVGVIVGGFALLMVVLSLICALLRAPDRWLPRGLAAGLEFSQNWHLSFASRFGDGTPRMNR